MGGIHYLLITTDKKLQSADPPYCKPSIRVEYFPKTAHTPMKIFVIF